ncbi:MAG TPA: MBL fold metallo-hydrolase [Gaiellaceae bacterium]|nr:MBL fold metallo-hydrolase [Gaiellaceae bacterium]
MRELQRGLWHWTAPHPEWAPESAWGQQVSSYALDDGGRLLLFDPLAVPAELEQLAAEREPVVVLTVPWHERDARSLVRRLRASLYTPPPDTKEDLIRKFGVSAEEVGEGSPDLRWLQADDAAEAHFFLAGDRLPVGLDVFPGRGHNDLVLWLASHRAVIAGDTIADFGRGLELVPGWLPVGVTREQIRQELRPLLDLPVELVLCAHGGPTDRAALERALA